MIIQCPSCRFERDLPEASLRPGKKYKITCPRCSNIFHFTLPVEEEEAPAAFEAPVQPAPQVPAPEAPAERSDFTAPASSEDAASASAVAPVTAPEDGAPAASEPSAPAMPERPAVPHLPTEQDGDDPLPPGAEIPQFLREEPKPEPAPEKKEPEPEAPSEPSGFWEHWQSTREHVRQYDEAQDTGAYVRRDGRPAGAPWESPEYYGFWGSFSRTLLGVMFRPREFFSNVRCANSAVRPILFYVLLSLFQVLAARLWTMQALREISATATDPQMLAMSENLMQSLNMPLTLLITPFFSIFQAVIVAGLYHLMIRLVQPDRADYSTTLRVVCYSVAPMVLCIVPFVGSLIASIWFTVAVFVGCRYALRLTWTRALLAFLPLYILELALVSQLPALMAGM